MERTNSAAATRLAALAAILALAAPATARSYSNEFAVLVPAGAAVADALAAKHGFR